MVQPPSRLMTTPTGRVRPRRTLLGRVVLQVELRVDVKPAWPPLHGEHQQSLRHYFEWRDARLNDHLASVYIPAPRTLRDTYG